MEMEMEMEEDHQELQLLPSPYTTPYPCYSQIPRWGALESSSSTTTYTRNHYNFEDPSLDLQLSISDGVKWQTSEQIQLAALESAYLERIKELTRREIEMAKSEFSRARVIWERAVEDVQHAQKLKDKSVRWINPTCMEITCQSCREKFRC